MNKVATTLMAMFFVAGIYAQKTDFTGTWQLKDQKSISGTLYSNGVPRQISVTQTADRMIVKKIMVSPGGEDVPAIETLKFDGKPDESTISNYKKRTTLVWSENGKGFTQTNSYISPSDAGKRDFVFTDTWAVEDGNLIFIRTAENFTNNEVWKSRSVYVREK